MNESSVSLTMLPVIQRWDCHTCGSCCKEYQVRLSEEEAARVENLAKGMGPDLGGLAPIRKVGLFSPKFFLNNTPDGACVFLGDAGRCKLHQAHGYQSKPLPCRLFPWVLIPQGKKWTVGVRFACPSAAENKGRPMPAHTPELEAFAAELVEREGIRSQQDGAWVPAPFFSGGKKATWAQFDWMKRLILKGIEESDSLSKSLVRSLRWIGLMKSVSQVESLDPKAFEELAGILWDQAGVECQGWANRSVDKPDPLARLLFRQCAAVHTRKDHGPKRGIARNGPLARLGAILRFSAGSGKVPRLHGWMPEASFEDAESTGFQWDADCEGILKRYYLIKINAGQFAGNVHYRMSICDGFASLALTFPIICWITRLGAPGQSRETLIKAISIVDDHFGFNRVLGGMSQRFFLSVLAGSGRLEQLIRWYGPERA